MVCALKTTGKFSLGEGRPSQEALWSSPPTRHTMPLRMSGRIHTKGETAGQGLTVGKHSTSQPSHKPVIKPQVLISGPDLWAQHLQHSRNRWIRERLCSSKDGTGGEKVPLGVAGGNTELQHWGQQVSPQRERAVGTGMTGLGGQQLPLPPSSAMRHPAPRPGLL